MLEEARFSFRSLRRRPAVAMLAALSLALGIGANSSIFSCLDSLYLRPMAIPHIGNVVRLFAATAEQPRGPLSYPEYLALRQQAGSLSGVAAATRRGATWIRPDRRQDLYATYVSPDFFQVLGVQAHLGRLFGAQEQAPVCVLGWRAWKHWFGGDPSIVGTSISIARGALPAHKVVIAGVLPPDFGDLEATGAREIWMPAATFTALNGNAEDLEDRRNYDFTVIARLAPGASLRGAQSELTAVDRRLAQAFPDTHTQRHLIAQPDLDYRLESAGVTGLALLLVVFGVAAIACVNVANLLLASVEGRRRELTIRVALGASRFGLARQFLFEVAWIGALALPLGCLIGAWLVSALPALTGLAPADLNEIRFQFDFRVLAFTVLMTTLTALGVALFPAWFGTKTDLTADLTVHTQARLGRFTLRSGLIVSQLALSLVLLAATGLLVKSFWNARHGDIGLARRDILTVWGMSLGTTEDRLALDRLQAVPGVKHVTLAFRAPLSSNGGGAAMALTIPRGSDRSAATSAVQVKSNSVGADYFRMLGVPVLQGRVFTDADDATGQPVAVISQTMARRFFHDQSPIGQMILTAPARKPFEIVGVVADAPINRIGEIPEPYLYTCWWQHPWGDRVFLIEPAQANMVGLPAAVRSTLRQINPLLADADFSTLDELVESKALEYRMAALLVAALGLLGLVLTAVGLYGVMSYSVTLRTREIGIRMAIGARSADTAALVVRQALGLALIGTVVGIPLALATAHSVRSIIFGISPWSPTPLLGAAAGVAVFTALAAWLPARRASKIDPAIALRGE